MVDLMSLDPSYLMIEPSHEQNCRRYQTEMQGQRERRGARQ